MVVYVVLVHVDFEFCISYPLNRWKDTNQVDAAGHGNGQPKQWNNKFTQLANVPIQLSKLWIMLILTCLIL